MSEYTKGPWHLDCQFESEGHYNIQLESDTGWRDREYMRVGGCCSLANALLITAAPDLLCALQKMILAAENIGGEHVTGLGELNEQLEIAYAAIAKATQPNNNTK